MAFVDRTLLVEPPADVKITRRLIHRRASEIAVAVVAQRVEVIEGSEPNRDPWRFTFYDIMGARIIMLRILGTRGQVYVALGNYLHGCEAMGARIKGEAGIF